MNKGAAVPSSRAANLDMEVLVGSILQIGVLLSMALLAFGVVWRWFSTGSLGFDYSISGMNFFEFVLTDIQQMLAGTFRPRLFANLGIATLMLTPYVRVFASMTYFAFAERNPKYTLFTGFVFVVLTYSLFLR
jgi:uncharacterized membrane protein